MPLRLRLNIGTSVAEDHRFPSIEAVETYLSTRADGVIAVDGIPQACIVIQGRAGALGARVPADGPVPDLSAFSNIRVATFEDQGVVWNQVLFDVDGNAAEVFQVTCRVLEHLQEPGVTFAVAVARSLDALAEILEARAGLSLEKQTGLFGEMLVMLALATEPGSTADPTFWRGYLAEEHDFCLASQDLEVKTTTGEQRVHWISSETQLLPTPGRPLFVVSLQITASGAGVGWSLPELIEDVRTTVGSPTLNDALAGYGYRDVDAALYSRRWLLRTTPAFFEVVEDFPALTRDRIDSGVPQSSRISDVKYRINLVGMTQSTSLIDFKQMNPRRT